MNRLFQIISSKKIYKSLSFALILFYILVSSLRPPQAFAEGNPFILTTDTMQTGLTPQIGGEDLDVAAQTLANMTDITGAYYDSTLKRIVFVGTTGGTNPQFNKDDMAVAVKSIFFNGTMPDVNIGDDPNNPSGATALVTYLGGIQNTNLGSVLFNTDYKLKQYAIGYDPSQVKVTSIVPTYKSVVDRYATLTQSPIPGNTSKFILSPQVTSLKVSTSENAFIFNNIAMKATTQAINQSNDPLWNQAASEFTADITSNYDQYGQETTNFVKAKQLAKVVAILKWITDYSVPTDMQWAANYTPDTVSTPSTVQKVLTPTGYSAQGSINYNTPNTYLPDDGAAANLKTSAQSGSSSNEDVAWTFTNGGQQYQAVAVASTAFKSLGAYSTSVSDFSTPIAGDLSLSFSRAYSSFSNGQFGIGKGWDMMPARLYSNLLPESLGLEICNDVIYFTKLAIDTPNGHETFTFNCPGGYVADDPSFHSSLVQNADETVTVTSSDQTKYKFSVDFRLTSIVDNNNNATNYSYDGSGKLTSIADTKSHQLTLAYNAQNLISSVTDWANRKVEYSYDSNVKLTGVKDPNGNSTSYGYDSFAKLSTITDRMGQLVLTNTYGSDARISTQKNASNITKTNTYDNVNKLIAQTDNNGRIVKTTYDQKARILNQVDPLNKSTIYTYGNEAVPLTQKDKNGNTTAFTYDSRGNVLSVTFPDTKSITYTYDNSNRLTKTVDNRYGATPKQTDYVYDTAGNQTQETESGITTKYTFDATGEALSFTDPLNRITTWIRDTLGNKLTEKDPLNKITNFEYDPIGRLTKTIDADSKQVSQTYDNNSNILTIANSVGTTTNVYDKENRLTKVILPNNSITNYSYNSSGSTVSVLNPLNNTTTYGYNTYQNLISQKDSLNNTTTHAFNVLDRQTSSTTPLGKIKSWQHDANGNIIQQTDANNKITNYQYDSLNRLIKITYSDNAIITYQYDKGNLISMTDSVGTSTYVYDTFNRMTQATNAYGRVLQYTYDNANNLTKITYPDNKTVNYTYDGNNRMLTVKDWNNKITSYTYNNNGTLATRTYPNGIVTLYTYDLANRLSVIEHKKDTSSKAKFTYLRDSLGNITSAAESGSFISLASTTTYNYDSSGKITQYQTTSGGRIGNGIYTYDKVGNILTKNTDNATRTYTYDADNKLTNQTDPTFGVFNQAYDNNGNQTLKRDVNLTQNLTYDLDDRLKSYASGKIYKYDGLGNRLAFISDTTTRYVNDITGSLSRVLAETDENNGIGTWYVYGLGIISEGGTMDITRSYYLEDAMGNTRFSTNYNGSIGSYNYYDPFGNGTWHSGGNPRFEYNGQQLDTDTGFYYLRARYYDPSMQRFITKDPVAGTLANPLSQNPYIYSHDNPINLSDPSGKCVYDLCAVEVVFAGTIITTSGPALVAIGDSIYQDIKKGDYFGAVDKASWFVPGATIEKGGLKFGEHLLQRMAQRGVTRRQILNILRTVKPFDYYHEGIWKKGYYDHFKNIFVAKVGNEIKTVILPRAGLKYVENLLKAKP